MDEREPCYAGKVLANLLKERRWSKYRLGRELKAAGYKVDQATAGRLINGKTQEAERATLDAFAAVLAVHVSVFYEGAQSPRADSHDNPVAALPREIREFVLFYYGPTLAERGKKYGDAILDNSIAAIAEQDGRAAYAKFKRDINDLCHKPGGAERILNKLQERSYILVADKKRHDPKKQPT